MRIKAAVLYEPEKPLRIEELSIPELKAGQVLVKVMASGVCRTQLNEIRGCKGPDLHLPHTLGHEGSGIVLRVGNGVAKVKPGDHVVLTWIKGEGMDVPSTIYRSGNGSSVRSGAVSTFMEQSVVSENRLVKISKKLPFAESALLGCAIPTGAGMVYNQCRIREGQSIAIFGVGAVGLSAVVAARLAKAMPIIAVDLRDSRLYQAGELGATHGIHAASKNPVEAILDITGHRGVDYAIEAAGSKDAMEKAFQSICERGLCVIAGNLPMGQTISIDPFELIKGKRIIGTWGGESLPDRDIPRYADVFMRGELDLARFVARYCRLEDINEALSEFETNSSGRILIHMEDGA